MFESVLRAMQRRPKTTRPRGRTPPTARGSVASTTRRLS